MSDSAEPAVVRLQDVSQSFPGPRPVLALRGVNLDIRHGEYLSLSGPSGAGKSTLLNLLGLLDRPSIGSYCLDGVETATLSDADRARLRGNAIGFVFQSFHLLPRRTVLQNVLLGMLYSTVERRERFERATRVLSQVGLSHRSDFMPSTLSGGERQRVALARALAAEPALLLADEPTGNLDQATSGAMLDILDGLHASGQTILVVTHDHAVASRAQRQLTIVDGVLAEPSR